MGFELVSLLSLADPFGLVLPVYWDSPNEIGFWSSNGLVTNMKQSLAFVTNSTRAPAFLCQRVSYNSTTWSINFSMRVSSGRFHLLYAEDFCKVNAINASFAGWAGIDVILERVSETTVNISVVSEGLNESLCAVNSKREAVVVVIEQTKEGIAVSTADGECGRIAASVSSGFFALIGETVNGEIAKQELFGFKATQANYTQESASYDHFHNRKLFKSMVRRVSSRKSRYVAAQQVKPADVLTAKGKAGITKENTRIIFQILSEITERAKLALDLQTLKNLVEVSGTVHFLRAEKTISHRKEQTVEIYRGLIELETFLNTSLGEMRGVASAEASTADERLDQTLEQLLELEAQAQALDNFSRKERERRVTWNIVLAVMCVFEFLYYVVFFCIRRYQTRNFKID
jgi:hypothetical protein